MASPGYGEHHPIFPIIIGKADQKLCPFEIGASHPNGVQMMI